VGDRNVVGELPNHAGRGVGVDDLEKAALPQSLGVVEELLTERGLDISYKTVGRWVLKFGLAIARRLRQHRPRPSDRWHLND
jgi:transposase-like protein